MALNSHLFARLENFVSPRVLDLCGQFIGVVFWRNVTIVLSFSLTALPSSCFYFRAFFCAAVDSVTSSEAVYFVDVLNTPISCLLSVMMPSKNNNHRNYGLQCWPLLHNPCSTDMEPERYGAFSYRQLDLPTYKYGRHLWEYSLSCRCSSIRLSPDILVILLPSTLLLFSCFLILNFFLHIRLPHYEPELPPDRRQALKVTRQPFCNTPESELQWEGSPLQGCSHDPGVCKT